MPRHFWLRIGPACHAKCTITKPELVRLTVEELPETERSCRPQSVSSDTGTIGNHVLEHRRLQPCATRSGLRHFQHVRPNRGPHTLGAPTHGKFFFYIWVST